MTLKWSRGRMEDPNTLCVCGKRFNEPGEGCIEHKAFADRALAEWLAPHNSVQAFYYWLREGPEWVLPVTFMGAWFGGWWLASLVNSWSRGWGALAWIVAVTWPSWVFVLSWWDSRDSRPKPSRRNAP